MQHSDTIQRFLFENHNVRGAIVHLNKTFQTIIHQHAYPFEIQQVLGETLLAAVMLSNSIKYKGQLTIQFQSDGPVKLLVAKCNHEGQVRALVQWQKDAISDQLITSMGEGQLVITIERDDVVQPYQSIVPLQRRRVSHALEHYFSQSEQLPAKFFIHVDRTQAIGMMLQVMPSKISVEDAFWIEVLSQLEQIDKQQLFRLSNEDILSTIFKGHDIRLFAKQRVAFKCNCNSTRMEDAIRTFGKIESEAILAEKQRIVVTCEYCGNEYAFSLNDIERIFSRKLH